MFGDGAAIRAFYQTRQGKNVCSLLAPHVEAFWDQGPNAHNAAIGFGAPFMTEITGGLALLPRRYGPLAWPVDRPVRSALVDPHHLPLQDVQLDRLLLAHALEFDANPMRLLGEAWRSLDGGGRLMVIVPHRLGLWARAEHTPFGHGRPYSGRQLRQVLVETGFEITSMRTVLFMPPAARDWTLRVAPTIERLGARWAKPLGGVLVAEANKLLYAPAGNTSKVRANKGLKTARLAPQSSRVIQTMDD